MNPYTDRTIKINYNFFLKNGLLQLVRLRDSVKNFAKKHYNFRNIPEAPVFNTRDNVQIFRFGSCSGYYTVYIDESKSIFLEVSFFEF